MRSLTRAVMNTPYASREAELTGEQKFTRLAGAVTAAVGCLVLLGWIFDLRFLTGVGTSFVSMKFNTALCFALLGAALWLSPIAAPASRFAPRFKTCASAAAVLAAVTLAQYPLGLDFGIDQIFLLDPLPPGSPPFPGRMAPGTAISFILLGSSLLLSLRDRDLCKSGTHILATLSAVTCIVAAVVYAHDSTNLYGLGPWTRMAPHTVAALLVASAGVLAIRPDCGPIGVLRSDRLGGYLARRILPAAILLPTFLLWLHLRGTSVHFVRSNMSVAIVASALFGVLIAFIFWTTASVNRIDDERAEGERRYRAILETTNEGFWITDLDGRILEVNEAYCRMSGYSRDALLKLSVPDLEAAESAAQTREHFDLVRSIGTHRFETRHRRKDGAVIDVEIAVQVSTIDERSIIVFIRDVSERKKAEAELERLRLAIDQAAEAIFVTDHEGRILFCNPALESMSGYGRQEILGANPRILKSGKQDQEFYRALWETIASGRTWTGRLTNKRKDGSFYTGEATISPVRDAGGRIVNYVAVQRDVTEQARLESELRQSQKMESIGRLAGGVAHDFNNILTAICGFSGFILEALPKNDPIRSDAKEILNASERAARLTRQLLAFSRKQILNPQVIDMNACVGEAIRMLKRIIGEDVKLATTLTTQACPIKVDVGQLDQVLLNLAVNARDAMPEGGALSMETSIASPSADFYAAHPNHPRGPQACLTVRDTGFGMSDEVKAHIFEPFFTTKEKGKGTGLGLSTVFGIVKQSGGEIEVESAPGKGATFRIYFPLAVTAAPEKDHDNDPDGLPWAHETVLVVEDEDVIRRIAERALKEEGYAVLAAIDGPDALQVLERHGKPIDLLVTDVVMPGMNGRQLAQAISGKGMTRRTLFMSGYTDDAIVQHGLLEKGLAFIYKPFSPEALLRKIREVLDGPVDQACA